MKYFTCMFAVATILLTGCGDKIQNARTSSAFLKAGTEIAHSGLSTLLHTQKQLCNKQFCLTLDSTQGPTYKSCIYSTHFTEPSVKICIEQSKAYKGTQVANVLKPQILQAIATLDSIIDAHEQAKTGEVVDFLPPIRHCVCLLTQLYTWLPDTWRAKVDVYVQLLGKFTCDATSSTQKIQLIYVIR